MDITITGGGLKQAITICVSDSVPKTELSPLKKALMEKPSGPKDKFGVPYVKNVTEGRAS